MTRGARFMAALVAAFAAGGFGDSARASMPVAVLQVVSVHAHGGGCRKSSPAGQCCHMEKKTGHVHCH
ncbi:MAG: hypothetical protein CMN17_06395 [Roseovarius sp.]|nr:hypothetical protein [Roseovarius sp.]MBK46212.1 hypothetical protein [Roseovarius sp.]